MTQSSRFDPFRRNKPSTSLGQTSDEPLTYTNRASNSISNASEELYAGAVGTGAEIVIVIPPGSDTGVHIHFGAGDAVTTDLLLPPGFYRFPTEQRIAMIRAGATSDVTVYWATGVVA